MSDENSSAGVRINKFLSSCGYESRRSAEQMIQEGRVTVNGSVVTELGIKILPADYVKVDGKLVKPKQLVSVLLNKPAGYVCTKEAQGGQATVYDLLPPNLAHLNYIGRLDGDSEGLLLLTNDGSLNQQLSHPSQAIEKEYWVTVDQPFDNAVLDQMLKGLRIPEGQAKVKYAKRLSARRASLVLEQGLKRQIREMFKCLGLRVTKLVRVRIGSLWGGDLEPGSWRYIEPNDLKLICKNPPKSDDMHEYKRPVKSGLQPIAPQRVGREKASNEFLAKGRAFVEEEKSQDADDKAPRLSWSRDKFAGEGEDRPRRSFDSDRPRRSFGEGGDRPRRSFDSDRPRRSFGEGGDRPRRSFDSDRPRRSFGEGGDRPRRSFDSDRPRRSFGEGEDRPRRSFGEGGDRPRRSFDSDRPRRSFGEGEDRPRRSFGEGEDRPRRSFGEGGDRPRRSFGEGGDRPRRSFGEGGDRPRRSFGEGGDRPRRSFGEGGDRPRGNFNGPRPGGFGSKPRGPKRW